MDSNTNTSPAFPLGAFGANRFLVNHSCQVTKHMSQFNWKTFRNRYESSAVKCNDCRIIGCHGSKSTACRAYLDCTFDLEAMFQP